MKKSKSKKGLVAFKIYLEKAYDRMDWHFLHFMFSRFGFPQSTIKLIMFCISSSMLLTVWNGGKLPA